MCPDESEDAQSRVLLRVEMHRVKSVREQGCTELLDCIGAAQVSLVVVADNTADLYIWIVAHTTSKPACFCGLQAFAHVCEMLLFQHV